MLENINWVQISSALTLFIIGIIFAKWISRLVGKTLGKRLSRHQAMLFKRFIFYALLSFFFMTALNQMGIKLSVLLGAAGILTVAIGFASQTAASNLVSGVFLLIEHPFKVGDNITVSGTTGTVESIDLLSTKIKTPEHNLIRVPNEIMIKSAITNLSYFQSKRADLMVSVTYDTHIEKAKNVLIELGVKHELVQDSPEPSVIIKDFADSAIVLQFMCWTKTKDNTHVKNELKEHIKAAFDEKGIEMPFPQLTVHKA